MTRKVASVPVKELSVSLSNADQNRVNIDRIVIHTMVGTEAGANSRFNNPASKVSAHYGVCLDGSVVHWVDEDWVAYHAGTYAMNQRSIGIEHEDGWSGPPAPEPDRPDVLYQSSAKLVADICQFYNIPCDRKHILKHSEIVPTGCPDALDIDRIVRQAEDVLVPVSQPPLLDGDHAMALKDLEDYRKVRVQGPEGNFQGFVDSIIGSDKDLPEVKKAYEDYMFKHPTISTPPLPPSDGTNPPLPPISTPPPPVPNWFKKLLEWFLGR